MGDKQVADLTVEELKAIISQLVDERLQEERKSSVSAKKRSLQEVMESIDRHRWTPPPGTPSATEELLFERRMREIPMPSFTYRENLQS